MQNCSSSIELTKKILVALDKLSILSKLKTALGCISKKPVIHKNKLVEIRNIPLSHHDLYHLEVARLERIRIGHHLVSGVHGINARVFHEFPIVEEYDGIWDEVRITVHEFLSRTSFYNTVKAFFWINWLMFQGINPIAVVWRHYISLKNFFNNDCRVIINLDDLV